MEERQEIEMEPMEMKQTPEKEIDAGGYLWFPRKVWVGNNK